MNQAYPFIRFFVSYGKPLAAAVAVIVLIAGGIAAMVGLPGWVLVISIVVAVVLFLLLRLLVEVLALMADMLLPQ